MKRALVTAGLAGGILLLGGAGAEAQEAERPAASGNRVDVRAAQGSPAVQVDVCGNAVAVAGGASAGCGGDQDAAATEVSTEPSIPPADTGEGVASGNTVEVDAVQGSPSVQAGACGNAVGVGGDASASCDGTQEANTSEPADDSEVNAADGDGIASGNTVEVDAVQGSPSVQAGACGNAVGVGGDASASCDGTQEANTSEPTDGSDPIAGDGGGIASGNAAEVDAVQGSPSVQGNVCGNAVGVGGDASASCDGTQEANTSGPTDDSEVNAAEADGVASGNAAEVDAVQGAPSVQGTVCGIAAGIGGDASASCEGTQEANTSGPTDDSEVNATDVDGIASGNAAEVDAAQGSPSVQGNVCGNAAGIGGDASASCEGSQEGGDGPAAGEPIGPAPEEPGTEEPGTEEPGTEEPQPGVGGDADTPDSGTLPEVLAEDVRGTGPTETRTDSGRPAEIAPLVEPLVTGATPTGGALSRELALPTGGVLGVTRSRDTSVDAPAGARPSEELAATGADLRWLLLLLVALMAGALSTQTGSRRGQPVAVFPPHHERR